MTYLYFLLKIIKIYFKKIHEFISNDGKSLFFYYENKQYKIINISKFLKINDDDMEEEDEEEEAV